MYQQQQNEAQLWFGLLVALGLFLLDRYHRRWHPTRTIHGTAAWATEAYLRASGMLGDTGLILGRTLSSRQLIRLNRYCHLLLIGGTGSGKGIGLITPALLSYRNSIVCFDVKGELFEITGKVRKRLGRVVRLAPFNGGTDAFNVLDLIPKGPLLVDQARALAEALVVRQGTEPDPHWSESAVMVITAVLVFVLMVCDGEERSLSTVRDITSDDGLLELATLKLQSMGGIYARMGSQIARLQDKERAGVLSTVGRHLAFLDSELVSVAVARTTFDPSALRTGITIFIQMPPEQLEAQRGLLRCWIAALVRVMGVANASETLFLLDEASAWGGLSALEEALVRGRSGGVRLLLVYQSDAQVKAAFKDKPTLIYDNSSTCIYLGASSYETAERISKSLGDATIVVETANNSSSRSWQQGGMNPNGGININRTSGRNQQEQGRALLRPDEVLAMNNEYLIAFVQGMRPILGRRIKYYSDPAFRPARSRGLWWLIIIAGIVWAAIAYFQGRM